MEDTNFSLKLNPILLLLLPLRIQNTQANKRTATARAGHGGEATYPQVWWQCVCVRRCVVVWWQFDVCAVWWSKFADFHTHTPHAPDPNVR